MNSSEFTRLNAIEWMLGLLLLASLYFHVNVGGTGFRIPNNIVIWFIGSGIGFYTLWRLAIQTHLFLPKHFLLILSFPLLSLYGGMLSGVEIPQQWIFRLLYIWGGALFLFSLFQYRFKQGRIDRLLIFLVIVGLLHSIVGLLQIFLVKDIPVWLPLNSSGIPTGFFQQINNQASFQVTVILIVFWLFTRPIVRFGPKWLFLFLIITMAASAFIVSYSGSRVGALGFVLALPFFIWSRWQFIQKNKKHWIIIAVVFSASVISANQFEEQRGLTGMLEKTTAINAGFSGSARLGMYTIAADVIKDSPIVGHGIGSFVRVWQLGKPAFYEEHPSAVLPPQRVSHPHNEIIFWLVEGGVVAILGLFLVFTGVVLSLWRLPSSRRYSYGALLIPIALHTQVELPFYISSLHWFVFLILLFVVLNSTTTRYTITLSAMAKKSLKIVTISGMLIASIFFVHTMIASLEFKHQYMLKKKPKDNLFSTAIQNPYFKPLATQLIMNSLLNSSIHYGIDDNVLIYAEWGEDELKRNPHISFYRTTAKAYLYLNQEQKACAVAHEGWLVYPTDEMLSTVSERCNLR